MSDARSCLKTALADRYTIDASVKILGPASREVGSHRQRDGGPGQVRTAGCTAPRLSENVVSCTES